MKALATIPATTEHLPLAQGFMATAKELGLPVACWQMPNMQVQHFITDCSGGMQWLKPTIEELSMGFLTAPFQNEQGKAYFMNAHIHYQWNTQREEGSLQQTLAPEWQEIIQQFGKLWEASPIAKGYYTSPIGNRAHDATEAEFKELVARAVTGIREDAFQKVVLSRAKHIPLAAPANPITLFTDLCEKYPTAFVSLISSPETGTWLGASPEILASINAEGTFRTIALAGTQARADFDSLADATWRQKEIEEQALVSRYIINCFKKIRLREFDERGPRTVQAGNLIHLRTDFLVDTLAVNFPELATTMTQLLHPTSAVCGMPKPAATAFINSFEGYDRGMYSGFLGPVGTANGSHLFVNLRCMQLFYQQATLYAGAGITQDSIPEREWKETAMKMEVMKRVLL